MRTLRTLQGDSVHITKVSGTEPQSLKSIASGGGFGKALATTHTTSEWSALTSYVPKKGEICVWSDYVDVNGQEIPGIKIGDGLAYAADLPFSGDDVRQELFSHISDNIRHITQFERIDWNTKVSCEMTDEILTFTTSY